MRCPEARQVLAFKQLAQGVEQWLEKNNTHPNLWTLLLQYLHGRGSITCSECSAALNLPPTIQVFAELQDIISWDNFIMGMVSSKLLPIQSAYLLQCNSSYQASKWILGMITQLLQVTHTLWIYRCVLVHNWTIGMLISAHKEDLLKEIKHQLTLSPVSLAEEVRFLLECHFDKLILTTREQQEYWLLAIHAAREASRIFAEAMSMQQQRNTDTSQRRV